MPAAILHASPAAIRRIQDAAVAEQVALTARGSAFYRGLFARAGIDPATIRSTNDLARLPFTRKGDLMGDPEAFRLQLPDLPVQERVLWDIAYTTGTTGDPTPMYSTTHDFNAILMMWARIFAFHGVRSDDIIANLFPLTAYPSGAFLRTAIATAGTGALLVNCLPGATYPPFPVTRPLDDAIRLAESKHATVLTGVPSFIRRLVIRAEEIGADFSAVRLAMFTGEACPEGMRQDIEARLRRLGAAEPRVTLRLGFTEAQGAFVECSGGTLHNPAPELLFFEIVDPETGERLPPETPGMLVMTHLNRRGTVLLRYVVGDVTSLSDEPCPYCGRTGGRALQPPFRADSLTKIRGMLINPDVIRDLIAARPEIQEYQIVYRKERPDDPYSMDDLVLKLATEADQDAMARAVIAEVREAIRVSPKVEFVPAASIFVPGDSQKARRVVDERG